MAGSCVDFFDLMILEKSTAFTSRGINPHFRNPFFAFAGTAQVLSQAALNKPGNDDLPKLVPGLSRCQSSNPLRHSALRELKNPTSSGCKMWLLCAGRQYRMIPSFAQYLEEALLKCDEWPSI